jgi:hypothetical protein
VKDDAWQECAKSALLLSSSLGFRTLLRRHFVATLWNRGGLSATVWTSEAVRMKHEKYLKTPSIYGAAQAPQRSRWSAFPSHDTCPHSERHLFSPILGGSKFDEINYSDKLQAETNMSQLPGYL